ncbi:hypothetical protein BDB00DRAFT_869343 [Zychaea mexicana]|uniref:uncharacterized protein n=1 Tax=Zychaea mexicana TaxID=64656 RepID=UPI0022FDB15B|nr:uncharacterized protein BDB00DRAFT_869343 [Zychaea mexicana]KAI9496401.1 hypothetical protein BDB00DRAFT_869343 [Zychaea mexicana]
MNAHHESKHSKFFRVGGSVGLCVGLAIGATSLFGHSSSRSAGPTLSHYMASSVVSVAAWMSLRGLLLQPRERFPALLYQTGAVNANTPLEHLRLLNNAPDSISNMYQTPRTFVHSRCN